MPALVETILVGTIDTVFATGSTASLANNVLVSSAAYTPTSVNYVAAEVEFTGTFSVAPTAGTGLSIWFLRAPDGTNYEDGAAGVNPTRSADLFIPFASVATAQRCTRLLPILPPGTVKVLVKNDSSGQTISAGWGLKVRPLTRQAA